MNKLVFKIIPKCFQDASRYNDKDIDFYIEENDWNDYGYYTTYFLHASKNLTSENNELLGQVNIMQKGQTEYDLYLLKKSLGKDTFTQIPKDFIAMSFTIELYQRLHHILSREQRLCFTSSLNLIFDQYSEHYSESLLDDKCFKFSLLRDVTFDSFALKRGKQLLLGKETFYDLRQQSLNVKLSHIENSIELNFSGISNSENIIDSIPSGIMAFIGKNGSGKSTAIYKLAKLIYANPTQRDQMKNDVGTLTPNDIGVNKLFMISYSPFDNFILPFNQEKDYKISYKKNIKDQRFIFCGIRDIVEDFNSVEESNSNDAIEIIQDRQYEIKLKGIDALTEEFKQALNDVYTDRQVKTKIWENLIKNSKVLHPDLFEIIQEFKNPLWYTPEIPFEDLSTGHKFFLHSLVHIIAYIEDNSLLLFDEPENHLHPPLLSFMISQIQIILNQYKSVILIATHSPIILQETFRNNIYIIKRNGDIACVNKPRIETYGENISSITADVFNLTTDETNYHSAFKNLYELWNMKKEKNIDSMILKFQEKLNSKLSNQMISYLINLYAKDNKDNLCGH